MAIITIYCYFYFYHHIQLNSEFLLMFLSIPMVNFIPTTCLFNIQFLLDISYNGHYHHNMVIMTIITDI